MISATRRLKNARSLFAASALLAIFLSGCSSCKSKPKEDEATPTPPPRGGASNDELTTQLGTGKRIDEQIAPTSVHWSRVIPLDEKRVIVVGTVVNQTIGLVTDDAGASWRALKMDDESWSGWGAGLDGSIVVAEGARDGAPNGSGTVAATKFAFAAFDATAVTTPTPAFPTAEGPVPGFISTASALPALIGADSAVLVGTDGKKTFLVYGGKPGAEAVPPLVLPGEKFIPAPYGRPASLLSIKGKDLFRRPFPAPGKPLDKPTKVTALVTPATLSELSAPPACETAEWSFQRIKQAKGYAVLGVSQAKTVLIPLPDATAPASRLGCGAGRVVVETIAPKTGASSTWAAQPDLPSLTSCDFAGKCIAPKNAPFRTWAETHKHEITMTAAEKGVLAVLSSTAGDHWGLYLSQGPDFGAIYERPRVIGEGTSSRGRIELGALFSLGKRAVLLLSADVMGTSRRGWFVMVSDDGGTNWGPP